MSIVALEKAVQVTMVGLLLVNTALGQEPAVPVELIGTWASSEIDCKRVGPTTLIVTSSSVTLVNIRGSIVSGRTIGRRSVEVMFDPTSTGPHSLRFRRFALSTDGSELYEFDGDKVLERRRRCISEGA